MPHSIHGLSLVSVPLTIKCNGLELCRATGFFVNWHDLRDDTTRTFLVTNWHVFTGRHPTTEMSERMDSGVPEVIEYPRFVSNDYAQRELDTVKLTDEGGAHKWCEHPILGSKVDVGVIEVPTNNDKGCLIAVPYTFSGGHIEETLHHDVASHLSVIGFPISKRPTGHFPIWIQATVASEMDIGYDGQSGFLVDALTSKGMSGSPVFSQELEPALRQEASTQMEFLGVYSGRIKEGDVELPLGIVWKREIIHETILRLVFPEKFD